MLHSETLALLNNLPGEDTYSWCKDLRSAKQRLEESKQKQLHIDSEDEHCYRELCRRIEVMLCDPSRAMFLEERYEKALPNTKKKPKEAMFMGLGDVIFPGMLVISCVNSITTSGLAVGISALIGGLVGYLVLMTYVASGRPQAGLPLLNGGAILGYIIGGLVFVGSAAFSFGITF